MPKRANTKAITLLVAALVIACLLVPNIGKLGGHAYSELAKSTISISNLALINSVHITSNTPYKYVGNVKVYNITGIAPTFNSIKTKSPCGYTTAQINIKELSGYKFIPGIYNCPLPKKTQQKETTSKGSAQQVNSQNTEYNTNNWSGYVAQAPNGEATDVSGSWIVTPVGYASTTTSLAEWVGIDGWNDATLVQVGTDSNSGPSGPGYSAWYELWPAPSVSLFQVYQNDTINASVSAVPGTSDFIITIEDTTRGIGATYTVSFSTPENSADWILENEELCNTACYTPPLSPFSYADFGEDFTDIGNTDYANSGSGYIPVGDQPSLSAITMVDSQGATYASPSGFTSDGTSFNIYSGGVTQSITTTISSSTITVPNPSGSPVEYTPNYCYNSPVYGTETSCSPSETGSSMTFCWLSNYNYSVRTSAAPIFEEGGFGNQDLATIGTLIPGVACTASVIFPTYLGVAGLAVGTSGTMEYGGYSVGGSNSGSSYTFSYNTDPGTLPEAIALMVACGGYACQSVAWPAGCTQQFISKTGYGENEALALCDQTEGKSYSVTVGTYDGGAVVVADARYVNGYWNPSYLTTTSTSTTTIPTWETYTASYCGGSDNSVYVQCTVPASSNPGVFCWGSAEVYSANTPSWPVEQSESAFGASYAAEIGKPWSSGSTCSLSIPAQAEMAIGGLSVTSSGTVHYGGESSGGSDSGNTYTFNYITDSGTQPEAVALIVACGGSTCKITWPTGCNEQSATNAADISLSGVGIEFHKTTSKSIVQAVALCNQTEGSGYSVTVKPTEAGGAIVVADVRFENGKWGTSQYLTSTTSTTTTIPTTGEVKYTPDFCSSGPTYGLSTSCSVNPSSSPGVLCAGSSSLYSINAPSWPVAATSQSSPGNTVAVAGSPWTSGSTCGVSVSNDANLSAMGLSVTSSGTMMYGGENSGSSVITSTTTVPTSGEVTYTPDFCSSTTANGVSVSCSVTSSSSPGIFCSGSSSIYPIKTPSWPVEISAQSGSDYAVAAAGSPWKSESICSISVSNDANATVMGLSVTSSGTMHYGGENAGSSNTVSLSAYSSYDVPSNGIYFANYSIVPLHKTDRGGTYTFTYSTNSGSDPEAVAIMVSCGAQYCNSVSWPAGCSVVVSTSTTYFENGYLALCNETEGSSYNVTVSDDSDQGGAATVSEIGFENGIWAGSSSEAESSVSTPDSTPSPSSTYGTPISAVTPSNVSAGFNGLSFSNYTIVPLHKTARHGTYSFTYNTNSGTDPEAVAIMVSCGEQYCNSVTWPTGCNVVVSTSESANENDELALCNETEGNSYTVTASDDSDQGGAATISEAGFENGIWT